MCTSCRDFVHGSKKGQVNTVPTSHQGRKEEHGALAVHIQNTTAPRSGTTRGDTLVVSRQRRVRYGKTCTHLQLWRKTRGVPSSRSLLSRTCCGTRWPKDDAGAHRVRRTPCDKAGWSEAPEPLASVHWRTRLANFPKQVMALCKGMPQALERARSTNALHGRGVLCNVNDQTEVSWSA